MEQEDASPAAAPPDLEHRHQRTPTSMKTFFALFITSTPLPHVFLQNVLTYFLLQHFLPFLFVNI
jgi:hypothetical protein